MRATSTDATFGESTAAPAWATDRIATLKRAVLEAQPTICPERALLWTEQMRRSEPWNQPVQIRAAEALAHVLSHKTVRIYPRELLVGNYTSKRVGGLIAPELHGIISLLELHRFPQRAVSPLHVALRDRWMLQRLIPYWMTRNLAFQAHPSALQKLRFLVESLQSRDWVINELGGIGHFAPNYGRLIERGTDGLVADARKQQEGCRQDSQSWAFLQAVCRSAEALARLGDRYAIEAGELAGAEQDPRRRLELQDIADTCRQVPRRGARSFREALQSIYLAQVALVNEGLDITICPGRVDQLLAPLYRADLQSGRVTPETAGELLACYVIKLSEMIPVFGTLPSRLFGGLPAYQTVVVGGTDRQGEDATNELSYLLLEVVDRLRLRQPNFHARLHRGSPVPYRERIYRMLSEGANAPALYNDEVIVPTLVSYGHSVQDARDYAPIGCVEPTCQGKSFASTDAVLFNTPAVLELALNQGRRFGSLLRTGVKTPPAAEMRSMQDVVDSFRTQLQRRLTDMVADLQAVERANTAHKPTPLSSGLVDGCIDQKKDVTRGGAIYNRSGIQCVGASDVGDGLRAMEQLVFLDRRLSLPALVAQLAANLPDETLVARLKGVSKFGNDDESADRWTVFVVHEFARCVESLGESTRGGRYVAGLYSTTAHDYFGAVTGALPSGRRKGEPFASGIAPTNGADRLGPTGVLNSMNRIDFACCPNGVNFNLKLQPPLVNGRLRYDLLQTLVDVYFSRGGMQVQTNVLDAETLRRAKQDPSSFPHLLVRVSGYSAYFSDLSESMQDEIIARTANSLQA